MANTEFVLSIGDDNVVLTRVVDGKVANAWLASPDPATATEELGEALAEDKKCKISVLIDTLDQTLRDEELPKVGVLDRRKVLGRHVNMAFPGANLRGARLLETTASGSLLYQFAAIPLDARMLGWADYVDSLPNDKGGFYTLAAENIDMLEALTPKDEPAPALEQKAKGKSKDKDKDKENEAAPAEINRWRHLIGVNATGGLRQIIEKNGRLCLTRLTQAPPPDTAPGDFADMISRDFRATITYIRRLGYTVGEPLDLVILTTSDNKDALEALGWEGTRSVSFYTPYEAAATLDLGSIGREDQAFCDVLHAAWFSAKRKTFLPLTRAATLGDPKDDLRELAFLVAPYAAGLLVAAVLGWTGMTGYETYDVSAENERLQQQLAVVQRQLTSENAQLQTLPYDPAKMRNIIDVNKALEAGRTDLFPVFKTIATALQSDAVVTNVSYTTAPSGAPGAPRKSDGNYTMVVKMRMADVVIKADEAVSISRKLQQRLTDGFGKSHKIEMLTEPSANKIGISVASNLLGGSGAAAGSAPPEKERFFAEYRISKVGP